MEENPYDVIMKNLSCSMRASSMKGPQTAFVRLSRRFTSLAGFVFLLLLFSSFSVRPKLNFHVTVFKNTQPIHRKAGDISKISSFLPSSLSHHQNDLSIKMASNGKFFFF